MGDGTGPIRRLRSGVLEQWALHRLYGSGPLGRMPPKHLT